MGVARKGSRLLETYARIARTYGSQARTFLILGAIVFLPLGLADAAANHIGAIEIPEGSDPLDPTTIALLAALGAQTFSNLFGEVFYSGAASLLVVAAQGGRLLSLRSIAGRLSYGRLIAVDLIYGGIVVVGFLLLIVPGVLAYTWFALSGVVIELENRNARGAFTRSRELVRGNFWHVLTVIAPISLLAQALSSGGYNVLHGVFGNSLVSDWLAESLSNILFSPLYALAVVVLMLELSGRWSEPKPGAELVRAS